MARLTDNNGVLLGGLETSLARLLSPLNETPAVVTVPAAPPLSPEYAPEEIVFALRCFYGSLSYLGYSPPPTLQVSGETRPSPRAQGCGRLIEEPDERHYCAHCGGYYCAGHAEPTAHECRSVLREKL